MITFRGAFLARLVLVGGLFGGIASAEAADLGGMKDYGFAPTPMAAYGASYYLRLDGGYSVHGNPVMVENGVYDLTETKIGDGWTAGGGIGRYFGSNVRGDLTADYRFEADAKGTNADAHSPIPGVRQFGIDSTVLLANLYYDFNGGGGVTPYVGVGLGAVYHNVHEGQIAGTSATIEGHSNWHAAGALMAGVSFKLTGRHQQYHGGGMKDAPVVSDPRALFLDVGYRFLYLGETETGAIRCSGGCDIANDPTVEDIHAHEFRVGLRYDVR